MGAPRIPGERREATHQIQDNRAVSHPGDRARCLQQPTNRTADVPSVSVTGATIVRQAGGDPFVAMNMTSSQADRITGVRVDAAVITDVLMTSAQALPSASPQPGAATPTVTPGEMIDGIDLAAGQQAAVGPGSYGIWLQDPKKLKKGGTVTLTFILEHAGQVASPGRCRSELDLAVRHPESAGPRRDRQDPRIRDRANRSWAAGRSGVPAVCEPGLGEDASEDDDGVGQGDERLDDARVRHLLGRRIRELFRWGGRFRGCCP